MQRVQPHPPEGPFIARHPFPPPRPEAHICLLSMSAEAVQYSPAAVVWALAEVAGFQDKLESAALAVGALESLSWCDVLKVLRGVGISGRSAIAVQGRLVASPGFVLLDSLLVRPVDVSSVLLHFGLGDVVDAVLASLRGPTALRWSVVHAALVRAGVCGVGIVAVQHELVNQSRQPVCARPVRCVLLLCMSVCVPTPPDRPPRHQPRS